MASITREYLLARRANVVAQQDKAIATANQTAGAIAIIDATLAELDRDESSKEDDLGTAEVVHMPQKQGGDAA